MFSLCVLFTMLGNRVGLGRLFERRISKRGEISALGDADVRVGFTNLVQGVPSIVFDVEHGLILVEFWCKDFF